MQKFFLGSPAQLVSSQTEQEQQEVLTGRSGRSVRLLTNWAAPPAAGRTGGGLGGSRRACGGTGAAAGGDVRLTYSDRPISSWGTKEPTNQS